MNLLGNLLSALNLSLQETIQSNRAIEDIVFGDKVIHIASGKYVSCILIVSRNSLITRSITRHLSKKFNHQFEDLLKQIGEIALNVRLFDPFNIELDNVRKYLAL